MRNQESVSFYTIFDFLQNESVGFTDKTRKSDDDKLLIEWLFV
jgi:hypothetical protein